MRGDERAIDAGCGSGRLTGELMERLPAGRLIAIDRSWNMLMTARANLRPALGSRVSFAQVSLPDLPFAELGRPRLQHGDVSLDQGPSGALRRHLRDACDRAAGCTRSAAAGRTSRRAHELAEQVMQRRPFAPYFADWPGPWEFANAEVTAERLKDAGFVDIDTNLEEAPTTLASEADYREFVTTVIYHPHLERLPDAALKQAFIDRVTELAAQEPMPFTLDYWRLNMQARKP